MRKLTTVVGMNELTFQPILKILMRDNSVTTELYSGELKTSKYTAEEKAKIDMINKALSDNNLPLMTDEEQDWAVGMHLKNIPDPTTEELERLAGYKVEKKIVYLDKDASNELA